MLNWGRSPFSGSYRNVVLRFPATREGICMMTPSCYSLDPLASNLQHHSYLPFLVRCQIMAMASLLYHPFCL